MKDKLNKTNYVCVGKPKMVKGTITYTGQKRNKTWEEKISVLLIEAMSEFATKSKIRPFGSDCSDVSKKYTLKFYSLLSQARKEGIEEFADWVWKGWNLDLSNKEKAVKHFIELKKKGGKNG